VEEAFAAATIGSAQILGMGERIGRLAPGFAADIVFLDLGHINYVPLSDAAIQLINGEGGMAVDSVMIDGRMVLERGKLLTVDEGKLRRDAEAAIDRLRAASADTLSSVRALDEIVGAFCLGQARIAHPAHRTLREEDYR
jgi:5-methylthioadenosine/S-adenosylhomocysteine deaminase